MGKQIRQVLRTYSTRWECWAFAGIWLITHVMGIPQVSVKNPGNGVLFRMFLPWDVFLGLMIGRQLNFQFANPRARLFPNFNTAHLIVAGIFVAVPTMIGFIVPALFTDTCPLAIPAYELLLMVAAMRTFSLMGGWMTLLFIPMLFVPMAAPQWIIPWMSNAYWPVWLIVFCGGLAGLAGLGVQLTRLSEEMPDYARQLPASAWDLTSHAGKRDLERFAAQAIARSRVWARWLDFQFRLVCRPDATLNPLRRVLLRQLTEGFPCFFFSLIVFVHALFFVFVGRHLLGNLADAKPFVWIPLWMLILEAPLFIWMSAIGGILLHHWSHVAHESLRRASRPDFIRDLFRSTALSTAMIAIAHCAAIVLGMALWDHDSRCMPYFPGILAVAIVQYVMLYSLALWLGSFHNMSVNVFGALSCFLLLVFAGGVTARYSDVWLGSPVTMAVEIGAARGDCFWALSAGVSTLVPYRFRLIEE